MEVSVNWLGGKAFEGKGEKGGRVIMDVPVEDEGDSKGPSPKELFLMSAAGCTGVNVVNILKKKRLTIHSLKMVVTAHEKKDIEPRIFTKANIHFIIHGKGLTDEAVKQSVELSHHKYCEVSVMMKNSFEFTFTYKFHND